MTPVLGLLRVGGPGRAGSLAPSEELSTMHLGVLAKTTRQDLTLWVQKPS